MLRVVSLLFSVTLLAIAPAPVSALCFEVVPPGSRAYEISPASLLSLAGSPDEVPTGSLTLEDHHLCEDEGVCGGFWAYGRRLDLVTDRIHWTISPDTVEF